MRNQVIQRVIELFKDVPVSSCDKTNFDPHLEERWRKMNIRMKEIGVEAYYEETKDLCRYL